MSSIDVNPLSLLRPRRKPVGISAILLPFEESGGVDWAGFRAHVDKVAAVVAVLLGLMQLGRTFTMKTATTPRTIT